MAIRKELKVISIIVIVIALCFGYWGAYHTYAEENDEEQTQETQNTQIDSTKIDETKQIVEEISTKIDKVDNQIASQKVDSQKIKEQAEEIEALKTDLKEVKATLATLPEVPNPGPQGSIGNPYEATKMIPLRTDIKIYYYKLHLAQYNYLIASNSSRLSIVVGETLVNNGTYYRVGISGIYTENNGNLKQPLVGIRYNDGYTTYEKAKELISNPDNWGYYPNNKSITATDKYNYMGFFKRDSNERISTYMIIPAGYFDADENNMTINEEYYTGIYTIGNADLKAGSGAGYIITIANQENMWIEKLADDPTLSNFTIQELYTPIMIIMSVLIIMLFKKH